MGNLFQELKRRKVFKVGTAYAVVTFVLVQVADLVLPTFDAPAWVLQSIIFLFVLGFPLGILLAWAYEVTPEGVKADFGMQSKAQAPAQQNQLLIYATVALVLLVAGF